LLSEPSSPFSFDGSEGNDLECARFLAAAVTRGKAKKIPEAGEIYSEIA
jgi:hypothetical protein